MDELWIEVKCQPNSVIARSPRSELTFSLRELASGGRALDGLGGETLTNSNQTLNAINRTLGDGLWGLSFTVERETDQTIS